MNPKFFRTPNDLRKWFEKNHNKSTEQWIGYFKKHTGKQSITWSESVDQAICFGWIDGLRKSIDDESYMIRFTPRKPNSNWSAVNIKKVEKLKKLGLMKLEGIEAFKNMESKTSEYSYDQNEIQLTKEYESILKKNKKAWEFFYKKLAPSYRKVSIRWVMSAKQEKTQLRRLKILIDSSAKEQKISQLI